MNYIICPKCNGQGNVSIPPDHPGDIPYVSKQSTKDLKTPLYECNMCQGKGILKEGVWPLN